MPKDPSAAAFKVTGCWYGISPIVVDKLNAVILGVEAMVVAG